MSGTEKKIKKLLLVEDQAVVAMNQEQILRKLGYDVVISFSGEDAIDNVKKIPDIDLILMDINLGKTMDGTEAAEIILNYRDIPILFLSGHKGTEIVEKVSKIQSYGYIVKDSGENVLCASIEMAFRLYEAQKKIELQNLEIEESNLKLQETVNKLELASSELESYNKELIWVNEKAKLNEKQLFENEQKFRVISEQSLMGICIFQDNKFVYANDAVSQVTGYSNKEFLDFDIEKWNKLIHQDDLPYISKLARERQQSTSGDVVHYEYRLIKKTGELIWLEQFTKTIEYQGKPAIFINTIDISERKLTEKALKESEYRYRSLIETCPDSIILIDLNGQVLMCNQQTANMIGYEKADDINGKNSFEFLAPEDLSYAMSVFEQNIKNLTTDWKLGYTLLKRNGERISIETNSSFLFNPDGTIKYILSIIRDVSERKESAKQLEKALKEKSALLNELQHRVKNSLTLITSLISLESQNTKETSIRKVLDSLRRRVMSLATLYNILLDTGNTQTIRLDYHLSKIVESLTDSFIDKRKNVSIKISCDEILINVKLSISFGLILNELITNSIKYAFSGETSGNIIVKLKQIENNIILTVSDNGMTLPENFDINKSKGLGLQLVMMLISQHSGNISVLKDENFTTFEVCVPFGKQ